MVKMLKTIFINFFEKLIAFKEIPSLVELNDTAVNALIAYNECNDKVDTMQIELQIKIDKLEKKLEQLKNEKDIELKKQNKEITPAKIIDEWFNGKEVSQDE